MQVLVVGDSLVRNLSSPGFDVRCFRGATAEYIRDKVGYSKHYNPFVVKNRACFEFLHAYGAVFLVLIITKVLFRNSE